MHRPTGVEHRTLGVLTGERREDRKGDTWLCREFGGGGNGGPASASMSIRVMHLILLLACLAPFGATGQPRTTWDADSVSVAFIVRTAVIDLATDGRLAAFPGGLSPWEISVPEQPAMWSSARSRLLEILGARAPVAADSSWGFLQFYPFAVRGDTLWASFEVGRRWRQCGSWTGSTTTMEVMSTRRQLFWEPATPRATFASDPVPPCRPER